MNDLTADALKALLEYDPITGIFKWKTGRHNRMQSGTVAGYVDAEGYRRIGIGKRLYRAHKLAWLYMTGYWPEDEIDHEDRCRDNNVWTNLRPATHRQNSTNTVVKASSQTGLKGVQYRKGRWHARITKNGRRVYLGSFDDPAFAHAIYAQAARETFGEYARP